MAALAYLIQFIVIALIFSALVIFGFSWLSVLVGIVVYLISTWLVSSLVRKKCPYCDSAISTKAIKCPKCQSELPARN
ncbi:hypothetical protein BOO25_18930 [Vibrio navarrensis]|uniref:hypothetical protein n=1 Tax=Vibrio navarrensis TaxID=29495 RepID=UPI00192F4171|nr:hypothetical protein [Vibrio navarrensis]MBE3671005.1 hypothetical protein [Vibrio navarrensis]